MSGGVGRVRNRSNAPAYAWGQGCEGWHLVQAPDLSVIQERMPAGTSETRHSHRAARQLFFVLAGRLEIELAGERIGLAALDALEVEPGTPHAVHNPGPQEASFVVVSAPPSHGDRVEAPGAPERREP